MYKPASKLPRWQRELSPSHRRVPLSRRRRLVVILALFFFIWYRYLRPGSLNANEETVPYSKIENFYTTERETHVRPIHSVRPITPRQETAVEQPTPLNEAPSKKSSHSGNKLSPYKTASLQQAPLKESTESTNKPSGRRPASVEEIDQDDQLQSIPNPAREASPEYAGDDAPRRQSVLGSKSMGESGPSDIMPDEPTELVRQASEKLVEQHLTPAVKYDKVEAEKEEAASKQSVSKSGDRRFPSYEEYAALDEKGEALPDVVHMPFEDTTSDVQLAGWEDEWFSDAEFDFLKWGNISEPKIDFVYTWVNGSEEAFQNTIYPYEVNSTLNDPEGVWLESHRVNRYRDWDELRYSIRSVEKYAGSFRNKIQLLVNAIGDPRDSSKATVDNPARITGKQTPLWLKKNAHTKDVVQILSQEDFFDESENGCLPTFNSLTIENQIFNTKSNTDRIFALSDDMLLGKPHAASDIYSPLFGPTLGFKTNAYNTVNPPTDVDARRFGEKPFLIYTSWLLNRRFGERKRKGQIHFGHSLSRSVTREAIKSFPRPALQSACQRFRGETGFQLYSWYVAFHYTIERHREALLWSYLMVRSDSDQNGNLGWDERQKIMEDLEEGMARESNSSFRKRMFYHVSDSLEAAGLEAPKVNVDVQWTSLDGPAAINNIQCFEFNVNECLAPGFSTSSTDENHSNYMFNTAAIFDRVARQKPKCGDCLVKLLLNRVEKGLSPLLPHAATQAAQRETVIKALWKYQYTIVDPDAYFVMITDAEQVENVLFKRLIKRKGKVGQLCLNDDVSTEEESAVADVRKIMIRLLESMVPEPSAFEQRASKAKHVDST